MSTTMKRCGWIIAWIGLVALGVAGYYGVDYYRKATQAGAVSPCIANLKQLRGAKDTWALERGKTSDDVPTDLDLFGTNGYIHDKPKCPQGGTYTIGKVADWPRCTIAEHGLDIGLVEVTDESGKPIPEADVELGAEAYRTTPYGMGYANTNRPSGKWIVVSKAGYETERVELPVSWPVKVTLKREAK
jgi:hypothetical protein